MKTNLAILSVSFYTSTCKKIKNHIKKRILILNKKDKKMQLSKFTDYAFRALIYLGENKGKLCTVEELARELQTSEHHMKKVVHKLSSLDFILSSKGRGGGLKLGKEPKDINLAEVLKCTEENMNLYVCFQQEYCPLLSGGCRLKNITQDALASFLREYSSYTLEDLL